MDLKLFWVAPISSLAAPISFMSIQSIWNNEIKLATYQSYISDEIASKAFKEYGIKTSYFENDKEVLSGFRSGMYDLAIVSSSTLEEAISQNLVKKIDWSKFSDIPEKYKSKDGNSKPFNNELFAPIINYLFQKNPKLYEYGVPYFLSYLAFVYTGEKLKNETELTWVKLLETISEDSRFALSKNSSPKLGFIEDELTIFYISKLISDEQNKALPPDFYEEFSKLSEKNKLGRLGSNAIFLHPNSALISEMISAGSLQGAFMYSGDALYTYQTIKEDPKLTQSDKQFNIFEGKPSLWLLDSIAISSKIDKDKDKDREEKAYDFLNKLLFKGILETEKETELKIDESSWVWKNFDFLRYTPPLKTFQKKLKDLNKNDKNNESQLSTKFEPKEIEILFGTQDLENCKWEEEKSISSSTKKDLCQVLFEESLSDSQNLKLALAFQRWKSTL